MSGHNCDLCGMRVFSGDVHRAHVEKAECTTTMENGDVVRFPWPLSHLRVRSPHKRGTDNDIHPQRIDGWRILERAASDLAGRSGRLVSIKRDEDAKYVAIDFVMRKDEA